jgi:hypothetical protein
MADEFITGVANAHPIIVDTFRDRELLTEIDPYRLSAPQAMQPFFEYVQTYYAYDEQLSLTGWHVYEFVGEK